MNNEGPPVRFNYRFIQLSRESRIDSSIHFSKSPRLTSSIIETPFKIEIRKFSLICIYIYDLINYSHAIFRELSINASPLLRMIDRCHAFNRTELEDIQFSRELLPSSLLFLSPLLDREIGTTCRWKLLKTNYTARLLDSRVPSINMPHAYYRTPSYGT